MAAETKQHVTGSPSPYSCDLSPTLERQRRTGRQKRWIERGERSVEVKGEKKKKKKNKLKVEEKGWTRSQNKSGRGDLQEHICLWRCISPPAQPVLLLLPLPTARKQRGRKMARSCKRQKKYKRAASHTQKKSCNCEGSK